MSEAAAAAAGSALGDAVGGLFRRLMHPIRGGRRRRSREEGAEGSPSAVALAAVHRSERQILAYVTTVGIAILLSIFVQIVQTVLLVHTVVFVRRLMQEIESK